jgi:DNA ligase-1
LVNFPSELSDVFYFFIVKLAPDFAAMETGIGHEVSVKAVAKATGKSTKDIREMYKQMGDLGDVIESAKGSMTTLGGFFKKKSPENEKKALTFNHVFQEFRRIATTSGKDSTNAKESIICKLL